MTGITCITGQRMGGVLAYSRGVVVASDTIVRSLPMSERNNDRQPGIGFMASLTQVSAYRMGGWFESSAADAVMTTAIGTRLSRYSGMVEDHTQPGRGIMAHITSRRGNNV